MIDRVGPYQIQGELGRGGMGVVYRAVDERLGRTVAIKALPEDLAQDPTRLDRFEREARTLASLNHPNLAAIYGVEEAQGHRYLVLEFVDGETLAERLDRGALDLDDAISLAAQIAAGVEAAHNAGVIHRDLKPANIKVTPDGQAKVLDFGLAKADEGHSTTSTVKSRDPNQTPSHSQSPTLTTPPPDPPQRRSTTMTGMILGTAAYMSPEQARGRPLDRRSDVWSFGVILYEMLTGASPFIGETATDSIGAVLHKKIDLSRLPPGTPPAVRRVIARCLERDKADRWRDLGDARIELTHAGDSTETELATRRRPLPLVAGAIVLALAGSAVGWGLASALSPATPSTATNPLAPPPLIVDLAPPEGYLIERSSGPPRLSPDGNRLALVVRPQPETEGAAPGPGVLCIKDLTTGQTTLFDQDTGIIFPTWSPDGKKIVYGANAVITMLNIETGRIETVIAATGGYPRGIEWSADNISTAATINGLMRLDLSTGQPLEPLPILSADESGGGVTAWPTVLDDGEHYLYSLSTAGPLNGVYLATRSDNTQTRLLNYDDVQTRYLPGTESEPGWLYFAHEGAVFRQQLDLAAKALLGEPEMLADDAWTGHWPVSVPFDVGPEGRLVYYRDEAAAYDSELVIRNIDSGREEHTGLTGSLFAPSFSADDRYIVLDLTSPTTEGDIVTLDRQRPGLPATVASDPSNETYPHWLGRDSSAIAYERDGDIYLAQRDGSRAPRPILRAPEKLIPLDTTPDGSAILYVDTVSAEGQPMHLLDVATGTHERWLDVILGDAKFCPDGNWIAVVTGRPDRAQLELRRFPEGTGRIILDIGADLGSPVWSQDRSRLVYLKSSSLHAIDFTWPEPAADPNASPEPPTFSKPVEVLGGPIDWRSFDINADGTELLYIKKIDKTTGDSIRLIAADPPPTTPSP